MATDAAKDLLKGLTTTGQAYEAGDPDARRQLLHLCKELTAELEQPGESFMRINWAEVRDLFFALPEYNLTIRQPARALSLRVALDMDIYKTLSENEDSPKTSAQLAAPKNGDPVLVGMAMPAY